MEVSETRHQKRTFCFEIICHENRNIPRFDNNNMLFVIYDLHSNPHVEKKLTQPQDTKCEFTSSNEILFLEECWIFVANRNNPRDEQNMFIVIVSALNFTGFCLKKYLNSF